MNKPIEQEPEITIEVEPIFGSKHKFVSYLRRLWYPSRWPIAEKRIRLYIKFKHDIRISTKKISFSYATIRTTDRFYSKNFNMKIDLELSNQKMTIFSPKIKCMFPFPGFYWIDVVIPGFPVDRVNFKTRALSGEIGPRESSPAPNDGCSTPIIVHDISTIRLLRLTRILVIFTIILAIDAFPRLIRLISCLF